MRIGGVVGSSVLVVSLALGGTAFADGHRGSLKDGVVVTKHHNWSGFSLGVGGGWGRADIERRSELLTKKWMRDCILRDYKRKLTKKPKTRPPSQEWIDDGDWTPTYVSGPKDYRSFYKCEGKDGNGTTIVNPYWKYYGGHKYSGRWDYNWENERVIKEYLHKKNKSHELDGGIFTAQVGLDRQFGTRFVGGVFADFDKWLADGEKTYSLVPSHYGPRPVHGDLEIDYVSTIGARFGILLNHQRSLLYGLIGYSWAKFEDINWQQCYKGRCRSAGSLSLDSDGLTLGGGFEHKLNDRVSIKAEYRYTDLDEVSSGWDTDVHWFKKKYANKGVSHHFKESYDTDLHSVRVLLSFKLGHDRHTPLK